ncbi:MAG: hypothetical protein Q8R01_02630 [Ramlibacter sp.]|nr:hypothetical protein [Ramlibacter sp.]
MSLDAKILRSPQFTSVTTSGPASLDDFVGLMTTFGEQTRREGDKRVLVNLLGVEGELKFTDHFQLGSQAAQLLRHLDKLASVVPADKITHTSEKVALKQGFQLRVFTSVDEATRWLCESLQRNCAVASDERA